MILKISELKENLECQNEKLQQLEHELDEKKYT